MRWCEFRVGTKLRPFSHRPGACCLIPTTSYLVQAFPTRIFIYKEQKICLEIPLQKEKPSYQFTLFQDLQRGCVSVVTEHEKVHILPNLEVCRQRSAPSQLLPKELLFLGVHKKQEWEGVVKRAQLNEFIPFWQRLGNLLPFIPVEKKGSLFDPFLKIESLCESKFHDQLEYELKRLFLCGFKELLVPCERDEGYRGLVGEIPIQTPPSAWLAYGARVLRSLFFRQEGNKVFILPHLPPQCFAGIFQDIDLPNLGELSFQWSQKKIKKVHLKASSNGKITLLLPPSIKSFRLRRHSKDLGTSHVNGDSFEINAPGDYLWDRFKK